MAQQFKVFWKRHRRLQKLPEHSLYHSTPFSACVCPTFERTRALKRKIQKVELVEYPATDVDLTFGENIGAHAVPVFSIDFRYKRISVPELNEHPATPAVASSFPSDFHLKTLFHKKLYRLLDVVISDYGDPAVVAPGTTAAAYPAHWPAEAPVFDHTTYKPTWLANKVRIKFDVPPVQAAPNSYHLVEVYKRSGKRYFLSITELNTHPATPTVAAAYPSFVPPPFFRHKGTGYTLLDLELNQYLSTPTAYYVGHYPASGEVKLHRITFDRALQEDPALSFFPPSIFGIESAVLPDPEIIRQVKFNVEHLIIEPIDFVDVAPEVIIPGTPIENANAVEDSKARFNICQRSGFRALPGELVKDGYGAWVLPRFRDDRHPQDRVKARPEEQTGPQQPEQDNRFIEDLFPDGVDPDEDL